MRDWLFAGVVGVAVSLGVGFVLTAISPLLGLAGELFGPLAGTYAAGRFVKASRPEEWIGAGCLVFFLVFVLFLVLFGLQL